MVAALRAEPLRYTDLHRAIGPAVSQKVLAETLHRMEKEGLIVRLDRFEDTRRAAFTARGAYELTDFAKALEAHLEALGNWHTAQRSTRSQ